jgi:hypothetical protein
MPLIVDPDLLSDSVSNDASTEVFINTATKRVRLNIVGDLSTDGVTMKALYSFLKEQWRDDPLNKNLAAFDFPMTPITDESFEFNSGWDLSDDTSRYLIRSAGWTVRNIDGDTVQQWAGVIGLGAIESDDQLYFQQSSGGSPVNIQLTGQVNQAVQILSDPNGDGNFADGFDRRAFFTIFAREQAQLYSQSRLSDIGVTTLGPQAYRFPLNTGADLKITHTDSEVSTDAPYSGMSITFHSTPQARTIGGVARDFGVIIDGNGGTAEEIYEFVQWALRQNADIDAGAGSVIGKIADSLLGFVGETLKTRSVTNPAGGGSGVFIDDYQTNDINRLAFVDNTGAERVFPFVATLTINFGANLQGDPDAKYWVYFTSLPGAGNDFGESGAILVKDDSAADIMGSIGGSPSVVKTFNYDGNTQGGRTAGTDAAITVVGLGLSTGQYVKATGTIGRSNANTISLVASLERNYQNP